MPIEDFTHNIDEDMTAFFITGSLSDSPLICIEADGEGNAEIIADLPWGGAESIHLHIDDIRKIWETYRDRTALEAKRQARINRDKRFIENP